MHRDLQAGLLASARRLLATLMELGQVRLELLGVEIEEQKRHIITAAIWAVTGLVLLGAGLVLLAAGILAYFCEMARWTAWWSLLALYTCLPPPLRCTSHSSGCVRKGARSLQAWRSSGGTAAPSQARRGCRRVESSLAIAHASPKGGASCAQ